MITYNYCSEGTMAPNVVKQWAKLGLWKPPTTGVSSAGLIDLKQATTYVSDDLLDVSSFTKFQVIGVVNATGTVNAAVINLRADFYTDDGQLYATDVPIAVITCGTTTNENRYTAAWAPGETTATKTDGTSPGTIATTGELPNLWRCVGRIKLKANIGTASTATTATMAVYLKTQS